MYAVSFMTAYKIGFNEFVHMNISNIRFAGNQSTKDMIMRWCNAGSGVLSTKRGLPHCILIEGEAHSGRHTLAELIAQAALCQHNDLCGVCSDCKKALANAHPDIEIFGTGNAPSDYTIDIIRNIKSRAYILPNEGHMRIIILLNAHNMSEYAQNALLKIIEEPPEHLMFILTALSDKRLLDTVLSRCTRLTTAAVSQDDAMQWLTAHYPHTPQDVLLTAYNGSNGNLGMAVQLLSSKPSESEDIAQSIMQALIPCDELMLVRICGRFEKDRQLFNAVLSSLTVLLRDTLAISVKGDMINPNHRDICERAARAISKSAVIEILSQLKQFRRYNDGYMNTNLMLSLFASHMICTVREQHL